VGEVKGKRRAEVLVIVAERNELVAVLSLFFLLLAFPREREKGMGSLDYPALKPLPTPT
jgi:hypothetical protein